MSTSGKSFYTSETGERRMFVPGTQPEGWHTREEWKQLGSPIERHSRSKQRLYTNGTDREVFTIGNQPDGWFIVREIKQERNNLPYHYDHIRFEILEWMKDAYDLTGIDLLVYAMIYSNIELTKDELEGILGVDLGPSLSKLNGALVYTAKPDYDGHFWQPWNTNRKVYKADPHFFL